MLLCLQSEKKIKFKKNGIAKDKYCSQVIFFVEGSSTLRIMLLHSMCTSVFVDVLSTRKYGHF